MACNVTVNFFNYLFVSVIFIFSHFKLTPVLLNVFVSSHKPSLHKRLLILFSVIFLLCRHLCFNVRETHLKEDIFSVLKQYDYSTSRFIDLFS